MQEIKLKYKCGLSWDDLVGEGTRYCSVCEQNVHNISLLQRAEAGQFLESREPGEEVCIVQWVHANGEISFSDDADRRLDRQREGASMLVWGALAIAASIPLLLAIPGKTAHEALHGTAVGTALNLCAIPNEGKSTARVLYEAMSSDYHRFQPANEVVGTMVDF